MWTNYQWIYSIVLLTLIATLMFVFEINPFKAVKEIVNKLLVKIALHNTEKTLDKLRTRKVESRKESIITKYCDLAEGLIYDYNLPLTLEGFNTFTLAFSGVLFFVVATLFKNIIISFLVSTSIVIAVFTYLIVKARKVESTKIEAIMDAEDLICPLAKDGVLVAIKKVLEANDYLSPIIRPYFVEFVDNCENHGYSFKKAMNLLNRQLGSKFDSFAEKAIVFEYNERRGMADIFLDIIDENAALREINIRKDRIFKKMNKDFLIKNLLIVAFVLYSLTGEEYREFVLRNDLGMFINGVAIITICLSFAKTQMLQRDISKGKKGGDRLI